MDIDKQYAPIYRNATVLLRPRTPLEDMYLALDPGHDPPVRSPTAAPLGAASTEPNIDVDQILSSLDADTRTYLLLLLSGGAQAFGVPGSNGSDAERRAGRLAARACSSASRHSTGTPTRSPSLLATRSDEIHRAIHNLNLVVTRARRRRRDSWRR